MKRTILITLSFILTRSLYAQLTICEVTDKIKLPEDVINSQMLFNPWPFNSFFINNPDKHALIKGAEIVINDEYVEKIRGTGYYWRSKLIRKATKQDIKKYADVDLQFDQLTINDTIYNYKGDIYIQYKEKTNYPNWFALKYSDFQNIKPWVYDEVAKNTHQPKKALSNKIRTVDLIIYKNQPLRIIDESPAGVSFLVGDTIVIGTILPNGTKLEPRMLKNLTTEKLRNDIKVDNEINELKLLPGDFDIQKYALSDLPYFKFRSIVFKEDDPILNLEYYDINDKRDPAKDFRKSLKTSFKIYNYDCIVNALDKIARQRQKDSKEYENYLKQNYDENEIKHIKSNSMFVGMREKAMYESIGKPIKTNTTIVQNLTSKQCIYGDGIFVYVKNGKVVGWQNIESLR